MNLSAFKAYDIRGCYPEVVNETLATHLGYAYAMEFSPKTVVIGHDARLSSPLLYHALIEGFCAAGVSVVGIGMCGTEEIYYASFSQNFDAGIMVTGSHNPINDNGFKIVKRGAIPVSSDSGLINIKNRIKNGQKINSIYNRHFHTENFRDEYIKYLLKYININTIKPLKVVADPSNGCAGLIIQKLAKILPLDIILVRDKPDGNFPNGIPNPLLPENREFTARSVIENKADLGIAWDGDFDRCFFYDSSGRFIEGYYIVGMIAAALLKKYPGEKIIHDPRLIWNTKDIVNQLGGIPIESKTGHAFIKERMRYENALYGGEMSSHHYFREFAYCDSGMIPWLLVVQFLSDSGKTLANCVDSYIKSFPCSGEINSYVDNIDLVINKIEDKYASSNEAKITHIDGLSVEFHKWRFNLRSSQTEPILRLNVESRGDVNFMNEKTKELLSLIRK